MKSNFANSFSDFCIASIASCRSRAAAAGSCETSVVPAASRVD
jgi:hypothetical protein